MFKEVDFEQTDETKGIVIKGTLKIFKVVKIPLENLKYNRQNGRIATWISEYINENKKLPNNRVEFNNVIEKLIVESNSEALSKTKGNIERFEQMEAAVVLSDGTLVDGNRRFTALRQLSREGKGQKFNYIKAIILEGNKYTAKEIKAMELNLQHAKEERVDYDPVDRLVDIYRVLLSPESEFSPEEYAREVNETVKKIQKEMQVSQLMVDYLEYIRQPFKFYIVRQQKLDGPLREIQAILRSKKLESSRINDARDILFASLLVFDGDVTRKVRDLKKVIEDKYLLANLSDKLDDDLDNLEDIFKENDLKKEKSEFTYTPDLPKNIKESIANKIEVQVDHKKLKEAQNVPIEALNKALDYLEEVDEDAVGRMALEDRQEIKKLLNVLQKKTDSINEAL